MDKEWPAYLMIRNTGIVHDEEGGLIYTTVGRGYTKHKYINSTEYDRVLEQVKELELQFDALALDYSQLVIDLVDKNV